MNPRSYWTGQAKKDNCKMQRPMRVAFVVAILLRSGCGLFGSPPTRRVRSGPSGDAEESEQTLRNFTNSSSEEEMSSCPNYVRGNPARRGDILGDAVCEPTTATDMIDHETAFGLSGVQVADWSSCGLPELPKAK